MKRVVASLLLIALLSATAFVAIANAASPAEPLMSPRLSGLVEPARAITRLVASPDGSWPLPLRLKQAGCSADGLTAILAFETIVPSTRAYAVIGFPTPADAASPGAVRVIAPLSRAEFDGRDGNAAILARPCD